MTPYTLNGLKSQSNSSRTPAGDLSLSLMISIGALRLVNSVERSINQIRHRNAA